MRDQEHSRIDITVELYINERPNQNVHTVIRVSPFCKEIREGKFEFEDRAKIKLDRFYANFMLSERTRLIWNVVAL